MFKFNSKNIVAYLLFRLLVVIYKYLIEFIILNRSFHVHTFSLFY